MQSSVWMIKYDRGCNRQHLCTVIRRFPGPFPLRHEMEALREEIAEQKSWLKPEEVTELEETCLHRGKEQ